MQRTKVNRWGRFAWVNKDLGEFIGHRRLFARLWYQTKRPADVETLIVTREEQGADEWWARRIEEVVAESLAIDGQLNTEDAPTEVTAPMDIFLADTYAVKGAETLIVRPRSL